MLVKGATELRITDPLNGEATGQWIVHMETSYDLMWLPVASFTNMG